MRDRGIINFETAKLASKKGYPKNGDWCELAYRKDDKQLYGDIGMYTDYPAPPQSMLQKWLRDEKDIDIDVETDVSFEKDNPKFYTVGIHNITDWIPRKDQFSTYEEALEVGLQEALKLIK